MYKKRKREREREWKSLNFELAWLLAPDVAVAAIEAGASTCNPECLPLAFAVAESLCKNVREQ
jgi:hypothetical protein